MRCAIKRLLKKHRHPSEGRKTAINTVMAQCEPWADMMGLQIIIKSHYLQR